MASESDNQANISSGTSLSTIWIIPILAMCIGAWMVFAHYNNLGVLVTVWFKDSVGLEAKKTKVKISNVEIGQIEKIELHPEFDGVIASLRIDPKQSVLLVDDTEFWVVRPRISKEGISGLDTLLSGAYIELSPGHSEQLKNDFIAVESAPVTPLGTPGLHLTLESQGHTAFDVGDDILFRGIRVGKIEYIHFNSEQRKVYYNAFIQAPHDKLVTSNTRFWEINGLKANLSADGITIETGTIETLLGGGITFDVPKHLPPGEVVTEREFFTIYESFEAIHEPDNLQAVESILLFDESIRGLTVDSPVEYRGIKIGKVLKIDIDYPQITNLLDGNSMIPVLISIEPARIGLSDSEQDLQQAHKYLQAAISKGLHGSLATGSLVTGSKFIELEFADPPTDEQRHFANYQVIPTSASQLDNLVKQVALILDKIEQLPLKPVVISANDTLQEATRSLTAIRGSANELATILKSNSSHQLAENANETLQEATRSLVAIRGTATELESILQSKDSHQLVANLNKTLGSVSKLTEDFVSGSETHQALLKDLKSLEHVLRELKPLLTELNKKPNSLIFGGYKPRDLEPKGSPK